MRNDTQFELTGEGLGLDNVPADIEQTLIRIDECLGRMVGRMGCPGGKVHQERPGWIDGLMLVKPGDGLVGEIGGQVVSFPLGRVNFMVVFPQIGVPLIGFTGQEPVEALEPLSEGPAVKRPGGAVVFVGGEMPFPDAIS